MHLTYPVELQNSIPVVITHPRLVSRVFRVSSCHYTIHCTIHNTLHNTHYTIYCTIPITQYIKQYPMQDPQNSQYSMQDSISHSWGSILGRHPTVKLQWWSSSVQLLHHLHHHYHCHNQPCVFDLCSQYIVSQTHADSNGGIYTDYLVGRNRKIQFVFTDRKVAPFVSIQWLYTFTTYMQRNWNAYKHLHFSNLVNFVALAFKLCHTTSQCIALDSNTEKHNGDMCCSVQLFMHSVYVSQCIVLYVGLYPVTPNVVPCICVVMHCVIRCVAQCTLQTVTPNGNMCSSEWAFQLQAWARSSCSSQGKWPNLGRSLTQTETASAMKIHVKVEKGLSLAPDQILYNCMSRCSEFGWVALLCWAGTSNVF